MEWPAALSPFDVKEDPAPTELEKRMEALLPLERRLRSAALAAQAVARTRPTAPAGSIGSPAAVRPPMREKRSRSCLPVAPSGSKGSTAAIERGERGAQILERIVVRRRLVGPAPSVPVTTAAGPPPPKLAALKLRNARSVEAKKRRSKQAKARKAKPYRL
jgi:hypothetical protein